MIDALTREPESYRKAQRYLLREKRMRIPLSTIRRIARRHDDFATPEKQLEAWWATVGLPAMPDAMARGETYKEYLASLGLENRPERRGRPRSTNPS